MLECLILGDSIAVGTSQARPECVSYSKGGINSYDWLNKNVGKSPYEARAVIISLGSNDHKGVKTEVELRNIRQLTRAERVYWIVPAIKPQVQEIVRRIAMENGDVILPIKELSTDRVHPTGNGYRQLAEATKGK